MPVKQVHYEELLAEYSNHEEAIALLKQYRPYLELIPSMRRSEESVITLPLPVVRAATAAVRQGQETGSSNYSTMGTVARELVRLPCDIAMMMCDPEWKIKTGPEILVFIHRPAEDFSDLLGRWRQTQVWLDRGYEWVMPPRYQHILSEGADSVYPLFVVFSETPERIQRGLRGASLPFVVQTPTTILPEEVDSAIAEEITTED